MKKIDTNINSFKTIIENNYYYVDKTQIIEELIEKGTEVDVFSRPSCFGKSLNMSMLQCFFYIKDKEENKKLFKNLYIENTPSFNEMGKYPVINISFRGIDGTTWEKNLEQIRKIISDLYEEHKYLRDNLDSRNLKMFDEIWNKEINGSLETSLSDLTRYLYEYYGEKVIVLIDEYDTPLIKAHGQKYYNEAVIFFSLLYGNVLKDNYFLKQGILTGLTTYYLRALDSSVNNAVTYDITDDQYDQYFGFTTEEVHQILKEYNLQVKEKEVRDWYGKYIFGSKELYNPFSVLSYINYKEFKPYYKIDKDLNINTEKVKNKIIRLINDETPSGKISIISSNYDSDGSFLNKLAFLGYCRIKEKISYNTYEFENVNNETKLLLKDFLN